MSNTSNKSPDEIRRELTKNGVKTRDEIVKSIAAIGDVREDINLPREIKRLSLAIKNVAGKFSLLFAICNSRLVRRYISEKLIQNLKELSPIELDLTGKELSLLDTLLKVPGEPAPIIVYGIELLLPSSKFGYRRRVRTLKELQLRREQFRQLGRPLLIWMPEYAYKMIGQKAVDFWSWQSGGYVFPDEIPELKFTRPVQISGDINSSRVIGDTKEISSDAARRELSEVPGNHGFEIPVHISSNLPPETTNFVGRQKELSEISYLLSSFEINAIAITGIGGIGKTSLAIHFAIQNSIDFSDGIVFVNLDPAQSLNTTEAMKIVVSTLSSTSRIPDDESTLRATYLSLIKGKRILLIFDNAPDDPKLAYLLPKNPGKAIITSRSKFDLQGVKELKLGNLSKKEAHILLFDLIGPDRASIEDIENLARVCGYHPLVMRYAGKFLNYNQRLTINEYIRTQSHILKESEISDPESLSLTDTINLQLEIFEKNNPNLLRLWEMLSVFPADFDDVAVAALWHSKVDEKSIEETTKRLTEMANQGLVYYDQKEKRYRVHEVTREWARRRLSEEDYELAAERHARHFGKLLAIIDKFIHQEGKDVDTALHLYNSELANIEAGWGWISNRAETSVSLAKLCSDYVSSGWYVMTVQHEPKKLVGWLEIGANAARMAGDLQAESQHIINLGITYSNIDRFQQAIECYTQALAIAREIGNRRFEGYILGLMGSVFGNLGESKDAIEYLTQSLSIARELGIRSDEGNALRQIGTIYNRINLPKKAINYLEQSLKIAREIGIRRYEGLILGQLGTSFDNMGKPKRAIELLEQSLSIAREIGNRNYESYITNQLGRLYGNLGKHERAIEFLMQSLSIAREIKNLTNVSHTLRQLGIEYNRLGQSERAIKYLEEALSIARKTMNRNEESLILNNLGIVLQDLGDNHRALKNYQNALMIAREIGDRDLEAFMLGRIGIIFTDLGKTNQAVDYLKQALALTEKKYGPEHPNKATALSNLSIALIKQGDLKEALTMSELALNLDKKTLGPKHPNVAIRYNNLANVLLELGDLVGSKAAFERALEIDETTYGREHVNVATDFRNLGSVLHKLGDYNSARKAFKSALDIYEKLFGPDHPTIRIVQANLELLSKDIESM